MGVVRMSQRKQVGFRQEAWADVTVFEVPYEGADNVSAISNAVYAWDARRGGQRHGYGVLRYDGGFSVAKIIPERKVVVLEKRICLVD
jgi:hypothetical protein